MNVPLVVSWPRAENVDLETAIAAFLLAESYLDAFGGLLGLVRSWRTQELFTEIAL